MLEVRQRHQSSDPAIRLVDHLARSAPNSESDRSSMSPAGNMTSPFDAEAVPVDAVGHSSRSPVVAGPKDLQTTLISFLEDLDDSSPGSLRRSGVVNHRTAKAKQTLLHLATVMGFSRLLRRLILVGGHLDVQDVNGFTPLAFAALCGQVSCARVLLEAGASYDLATNLGELPLDLAKGYDQREVETILISAVWSTAPDPREASPSVVSLELDSEIDDDNPSSESDGGGNVIRLAHMLRPRRFSRKVKGKRSMDKPRSRRISPDATPHASTPAPQDDPPPYAPADHQSWMSRTLSTISHPTIPGVVWQHMPSMPTSLWPADKVGHLPGGWIALPAPTWESFQKMTKPEDIKMFTQAMAAAAMNAVVQSGATTSKMDEPPSATRTPVKVKKHQRRASEDSQSSSGRISASEVVRQVKRESSSEARLTFAEDRMLYLFWLPVLLFVGFWLLVTALPIATGFCLIYARQISRAIKQRL